MVVTEIGTSASPGRKRRVPSRVQMGFYETLWSTNLLCECDHIICLAFSQLPSIEASLLSSLLSLCRRSIFRCLPPTVFWSVLSGSIYLTTSAYSCSFYGPPPKSQVPIHHQRRLLFSFIWEKTLRSTPIDMERDSEVVSIAISFRCAVTLLSVA